MAPVSCQGLQTLPLGNPLWQPMLSQVMTTRVSRTTLRAGTLFTTGDDRRCAMLLASLPWKWLRDSAPTCSQRGAGEHRGRRSRTHRARMSDLWLVATGYRLEELLDLFIIARPKGALGYCLAAHAGPLYY